MEVLAKFTLHSITSHISYNNSPLKTFKFFAEYDPLLPEDKKFQEATPVASMEISVTNPAVIEEFQLGDKFYVKFNKIKVDK